MDSTLPPASVPMAGMRRFALVLAGISAAVAALALTGWATGEMAVLSGLLAISFLATAVLLARRPVRGLLGSDGPGGVLARRLVPAAILVPSITGLLRLKGERLGLYGTETGTMLFALAMVAGIVTLVYFTARSLDGADRARRALVRDAEIARDRVRLIVATAEQAFVAIDAGGAVTEWNSKAEEMFGWSRSEVVGRQLADLVIPEAMRDAHRKGMARFMATGEGKVVNRPVQLNALHRDGHEFPVEMTISPLEVGGEWTFNAFIQDITERKATTDALAAGEARFRALATQSPGGAYEVNIEGMVTSGNDKFMKMTGLTEADFGEVAYMDLVHPDDRDAMSRLWFESVESGEHFRMEYRFVSRDGEVTWVSGQATTVRDPAGEPTGYFGAVLDITSRRLIEAELRLQGQITEHMAEGVVLVRHSDDQIVFANRRFSDIFGYELGEIEGMIVNQLHAPSDVNSETVAAEMQSAVAEYGFWTGNVPSKKKDGTPFWCHATVSVFEHPGHGMVSVAVHEDITDRKRADDELRQERRLLGESQEIGGVGSWEWDLETNLVTWSAQQFRLFGLEPTTEGPSPALFLEVVHPDDRDEVGDVMGRLMITPGPVELEYRVVMPDGDVRVLAVRGDLAPGATLRLAGTSRDITGEREAERAVRKAERRFRGAFENAPIGMAELTLDGRFMSVNPAMCEIVGHPAEELEGRSFESITHPDDLGRDKQQVRAMLAGHSASRHAEKRYLHANGHPVWVQLNGTLVRDEEGEPDHFLIQVQDITDRRRWEQKLQHMADHDPLTGLPNRRSFERGLERHVAEIERYGAQGAAIVLDLDNFKYYNDTLGHHVGDELIVRMSRVLQGRLRESDVLARLGGDEFAVILPKEDANGARLVANALLDCIRAEGRKIDSGRGRSITASIGVAMFDDEEHITGEDVLVNADLAMYDAKEAGRDRIAFYSSEDHSHTRMKGRMKWVDQIRTALDEDGFTLLAQPITDLSGTPCDRYELLLRMNGPDGDLIPPGTFLYIAERLGWVNEIDRWVTRQAIQILAEQRDLGREIFLEVNLSGLSIGDDELLAQIEQDLNKTGVDPSHLTFEITETAAVANIAKARHFAERLSEFGCKFALDDFGAGFGSFYYLKHLPFDFLKIDGEFVKGCTSSETDRLLIEAVVGIARGMGKRTIAEFVGDDETVRTLRRLGVDLGQGYHLGRPAPLADLLGAEIAHQ